MQYKVSGVAMYVLLYFLFLVIGSALSGVPSTPSNGLKGVEAINVTVIQTLKDPSFQKQKQQLFDHYGSWGDSFQTASMQLARIYKDMLKTITGVQQSCTEKRDCTGADKTCCWVPGSNYKRQCVKETNLTSTLNHTMLPVSNRQVMLNNILSTIHNLPSHFNAFVLPVGQGDCIAMYCPNGNLVMFDCGSKNQQSALTANELKDLLSKAQIITIFISHADEDHYNYLPTILDDIGKIDHVIIGGEPEEYIHGNIHIRKWMITVSKQKKLYAINKCIGSCELHTVTIGKRQRTGKLVITHGSKKQLSTMNICGNQHNDISFDIIAANVGSTKNQKSIVLKVTAGSQSMLLAGDIEGSAARTVATTTDVKLKMPDRLRSNVFQISHHGASSKANEFEWLHAISPKQAFVSHPFIGQFGHPKCETITNLISIGSIGTSSQFITATHPFTCNKRKNKDFVPHSGNTCHHIFSTYPGKNVICTIMFELGQWMTKYTCYELKF